jgi:hypothetical protein
MPTLERLKAVVIHGLKDNSRDRLLNIIWKSLLLINNIQIIIIQIAFKFKILIPEVTFLSSSRRAIIEDARAFLKTMVILKPALSRLYIRFHPVYRPCFYFTRKQMTPFEVFIAFEKADHKTP